MRLVVSWFLIALLGLSCAHAWADEVTVRVDRTTVVQDEMINVVFTSSGEFDGEPDFSPLEKDFQVLAENRSTNLQVTAGNFRYQRTWTLSLLPKSTGQLTLPAVQFGQEQSPEQTIIVAAASQDKEDLGDLFLEAELTPTESYVQGQLLYTVRIHFRGWLVNGDLSPPQVGGDDVVVQSLGEPRRYSKFINGERYQVYERRHALFPQASGPLTVAEVVFSGQLRLPNGTDRLKRASAPAQEVEIKSTPPGFSGQHWLPASNVTLEEVWPSDTLVFEQGVPITRTISIVATGLSAAQIPPMQPASTDEVRTYPDAPKTSDRVVEDGVQGTRTETIALVPQRAGDITLPAVEVIWWDTKNNREQIARLPERIVTVATATGNVITGANIEQSFDGAASGALMRPRFWHTNPWFYATLLCGAGWLLTLWRAPRRRTRADTADSAETERYAISGSALRRELHQACIQNKANDCDRLLSRYLTEHLRHSVTGPSDVANSALQAQWSALREHLYARNDAPQVWREGQALWGAVETVATTSTKRGGAEEGLAPLAF